jgi:hypothetical protein
MRNQLDRERGESGDGYDRVVVRLNAKWRIVECRAHIQWILQRRKSASEAEAKAAAEAKLKEHHESGAFRPSNDCI